MVSQIAEIKSEAAFIHTLQSSKKPSNYRWITVNTRQPLENYIQEVMNYTNN